MEETSRIGKYKDTGISDYSQSLKAKPNVDVVSGAGGNIITQNNKTKLN